MIVNIARVPAGRKLNSFSLVELLVVISIAAILAVLSIGAYGSITRSMTLTTSTQMLISGLNLARQTATARNADVEFRLYYLPDSNASTSGTKTVYRAFQTFLIISGSTNQLSQVSYLPGLAIISPVATKTTLFNLPVQNASACTTGNSTTNSPVLLPGFNANYQALVFRFSPNGGLEPPPASVTSNPPPWLITVILENDPLAASLPKDFGTVLIDPFNGSSTAYRP